MTDSPPAPTDTITNAMLGTDILRASWDRCTNEYGLRKNLQKPIIRVSQEKIVDARKPMEEIIAETGPILDRIRETGRSGDYCVLMCNSRGTVVEGYADSSAARELAEAGLRQGAQWDEAVVGTNGVGTSIIARAPITVCGNNHFNKALRDFNCCAAPFFAPDGRVLGVLDLSGKSNVEKSNLFFVEHFVREAAGSISRVLFRKWHRTDRIIALASDPTGLDLSPSAMIAANDAGQIIGATPEALLLLGVAEVCDLENRTVDSLWNVSIDDLRPMTANHIRLSTAGGLDAYAIAYDPPKIPRANRSHSGGTRQSSLTNPTTTIENHDSSDRCKSTSLDAVAGDDNRMQRCVDLSRKLLNSDIPILLLGETGVGKDRFARAFHDESARHQGPFTAVNCAAIPEALLASELFGYAPGTFTGGLKSGRVGKLAASKGGTVFLNEIGDMPIDLQAHLLRVLEDREVTPLGSRESVSINVRIICATHQKLREKIAQGLFRSDLYYRIKGAELTLSPLRERSDIRRIIETIVAEERGNGAVVDIDDDVIEILQNYTWPGNIRELKSMLRLILSINDDDRITKTMLPEELLQDAGDLATSANNLALHPTTVTNSTSLEVAQEKAERQSIVNALKANKWSVTKTAKELAISRATLHRKIRKHEIISPNEQKN